MSSPMNSVHQEVIRLHSQGYSATQTGIQIGKSRSAVAGYWWRLGLVRNRPPIPPEELATRNIRSNRSDKKKCKKAARPRPKWGPCWESRFVNPCDRRAGR